MAKYQVTMGGETFEVEGPDGLDAEAVVRQAMGQGPSPKAADPGRDPNAMSYTPDASDLALQAGAATADWLGDNAGKLATGAGLGYGGNQIRKGLMGMGRQGGAPAAGAPGPSPTPGPSAGPSAGPSPAGGTPAQQGAAKSATQSLRSQQLHGTLPPGQAQHLGGSKAWTVNPSGIITPDSAMEQPAARAAQSAPQQAAKQGLMGKAQNVVNQAGKVVGKLPGGQLAKMAASGLVRFIPGVGWAIAGVQALGALNDERKKIQAGERRATEEDLATMAQQSGVSAAQGGHFPGKYQAMAAGGVAHMADGGDFNELSEEETHATLGDVNSMSPFLGFGKKETPPAPKPVDPFGGTVSMRDLEQVMKGGRAADQIRFDEDQDNRGVQRLFRGVNIYDPKMNKSGGGLKSQSDLDREEGMWADQDQASREYRRGVIGPYADLWQADAAQIFRNAANLDPKLTGEFLKQMGNISPEMMQFFQATKQVNPYFAPGETIQKAKGLTGKIRQYTGRAMGGPVGMMKAQIGNYRAGGRIL